jgi:hypothetical protein
MHRFRLARRTARLRAAAFIASALGIFACDSVDRLAPAALGDSPLHSLSDSAALSNSLPSDTLTDAQLEANEALPEAAFVTANKSQGIAFGPFDLPNSMLGSNYTGSIKAVGPGDVLGTLAAARRAGARILVRLSAGNQYWLNKDHTVNLEKWKSQVARFKGVDLQPYINDGTLLGHVMIDEPHDQSNWGGKPVPYATLEAMARYSKQLWPGMTTVIRSYPDWLAKASFKWSYLDATVAQYTAAKGDINSWVKNQASYAKQEGLGLMFSMNLLNGGNKSSGIKGLYKGMYSISASQLKSWGSLLATHPQACALFGWSYSSSYFGRSDIKAAMAYLASKTETRGRVSCRDASGSSAVEDHASDSDSSHDGSQQPAESSGSTSISLRVSGRVQSKAQYMTLDWTGAKGSRVEVERAGASTVSTENDGHFVLSRRWLGRVTYTYKVCQSGTSICSESASVSFK